MSLNKSRRRPTTNARTAGGDSTSVTAVSSVSATFTGTHAAVVSSALTTSHNADANSSATPARPSSAPYFTRAHQTELVSMDKLFSIRPDRRPSAQRGRFDPYRSARRRSPLVCAGFSDFAGASKMSMKIDFGWGTSTSAGAGLGKMGSFRAEFDFG